MRRSAEVTDLHRDGFVTSVESQEGETVASLPGIFDAALGGGGCGYEVA